MAESPSNRSTNNLFSSFNSGGVNTGQELPDYDLGTGASGGYNLVSSSELVEKPVEGEKSFLTALILSLLFGVIGAERFYLGKYVSAVLKLLTFGGFFIWIVVDVILIVTGNMRDKFGDALRGAEKNRKIGLIIAGVYGGLVVLSLVFQGIAV